MGKSKKKIFASASALLIFQTGLLPLGASAQLTESGMNPIKLPASMTKHPSLEKDQSLEAILKPQELPTTPVTPISLAGIKIPGVTPATTNLLAQNHFVVINNTNFETMGDLYRDNRLKGKPNFVTLDSIVHPYFATTNGLIAAVIEEHVMPELKQVLHAMLKAAVEDYRRSEDAEIKDDIQRNLAFLIVAIRLIEPSIKLPDMGGATDLSDREMKNIDAGFKTRSEIFDREENFEALAPLGWFAKREKLAYFYRCAQWISRMDFPLTDVTVDTETGSGNLFRRSVLLYRALDRATINGKPAVESWQRLVQVWELFATSSLRNRQRTLLYTDFKAVVPGGIQDLKTTLNNLASPFFRTKLLLSVRKQKPVGLGATSIFDLADSSGDDAQHASFRLMPLIEDPEIPWLRARAGTFTDDDRGTVWCPLSLLILHARGAQAATNVLYNGISVLQPDLNKPILELERAVAKPKAGQPLTAAWERSWNILSGYFKQFPTEAQGPLKTDLWMSRHLESAFSGWVDAHIALAEIKPDSGAAASKQDGVAAKAADTTASKPGDVSATKPADGGSKPTDGATVKPADGPSTTQGASNKPSTTQPSIPAGAPVVKPASFHYLEPVPGVFRAIETDARTLQDKLTALGFFPAQYEQRLNDFKRLAQRLAQIADAEIEGKPTSPVDFKLLAGIDFILDQVSSPLPGALSIIAPTEAPAPTINMPSHSLGMTPGAALTSGSSILNSGKTALSKTASNILSAAATASHSSGGAASGSATASTGAAGSTAGSTANSASASAKAKQPDSIYKRQLKSANLVLGRPGLVLMLCQTSQGAMLVRGGVYTFYEVSGTPLRTEHLKRKLQFDLLRPPVWARTFDVIQEATGKEPLFKKMQ
ncbi:MAG: hypothetical protein DKT66_14240 [Candidatus Melainabacteria bacterium]|nr:MAG: hypothetical protein DKT66_14240 [Candidatus Melainabacteria bacterium]